MRSKKHNGIRRTASVATAAFLFLLFCFSPFGTGGCSCSSLSSAEAFAPAVVTLVAETDAGSERYGSGVVIERTEAGYYCLTNAHVVLGTRRITATSVCDGGKEAELLGLSAYHDIALLFVRGAYAADAFPEIRTAKAAAGETNFTLGNRGNGGVTVSEGKCQTADRTVRAALLEGEGVKTVPVIGTTADVSEGVSGGALLDGEGRLLGIATYRAEEADDANAFFAVPIDLALSVARDIRAGRMTGGRVAPFGEALGAFGVCLSPDTAEWGVAVSPVSLRPHAVGFLASAETDGGAFGWRVTRTGTDCPLEPGDFITAVGALGLTDRTYAAVFEELYRYAADGSGDTLTVALRDGRVVPLSGGGIALRAKSA